MRRALIPDLTAQRRRLRKSLHASTGIRLSVILMFFLISGLGQSGVWDEQLTHAWSAFPAAKYDDIPLSDVTHASMNQGSKKVPWAIEQTPMPASGSRAGHDSMASGRMMALDTADIDRIDAVARDIGFEGCYRMNLPAGETGVWTVSRDSMTSDSPDPTDDRAVHVDRYTGNILADMRFAD